MNAMYILAKMTIPPCIQHAYDARTTEEHRVEAIRAQRAQTHIQYRYRGMPLTHLTIGQGVHILLFT